MSLFRLNNFWASSVLGFTVVGDPHPEELLAAVTSHLAKGLVSVGDRTPGIGGTNGRDPLAITKRRARMT